MSKTLFKIFIRFTFTAAVTAMMLFVMNVAGFAFLGGEVSYLNDRPPRGILNDVSKELVRTEGGFYLKDGVLPDNFWCIFVNDKGDVIWSQNKPDDVPEHYTLKDIAVIKGWFLNDYPVYINIENDGMLIMGIPKNAVAKYYIEYTMDWFDTFWQRLLCILLVNLILASVLSSIFGIRLYRRLKILFDGINDLRREKAVNIKEKGIFRELYKSINETSKAIGLKNSTLAARDTARSEWVSGISHDIRTPLSVVIGSAEALEERYDGDGEICTRAGLIKAQSLKIKKLVEDLNVISSLEYGMQPLNMGDVALCPLIRRVVSDIINSLWQDKYDIELCLEDESAVVRGDEYLLERAFFNLVNNCIVHNGGGCRITITLKSKKGFVFIVIKDDGRGVPEDIIRDMDKMPASAHGLGLPMAKKIMLAHKGSMSVYNDNGFNVCISLPVYDRKRAVGKL